jgi:hypothetical protein
MFEVSSAGLPPFWTYRRLVDGSQFDPTGQTRDVVLINWAGNDYHWENVIDRSPADRARILGEARRLSLGFLHWLQTEAPHPSGSRRGYPGLRLLPEVMGTWDGLSKTPYVRESRRIQALQRIVEDDIVAIAPDGTALRGARATAFGDSVGIGWYAMDLHDCVGAPTSMYAPTRPFQIPLGALVPRRVSNLVAACKNIGTTHLTNGSYRLHPVEWNIGESAGTLAAFCCSQGCTPRQVWENIPLTQALQVRLLRRGIPLAWTVDVPLSHPLHKPAQLLVVSQAIPEQSSRFSTLELQMDDVVSGQESAGLERALGALGLSHDEVHAAGTASGSLTWRSACAAVAGRYGAQLQPQT